MNAFLVDTNVVSELTKVQPNEQALDWLCENSNEMGLSSITVKELYFGAMRMPDCRRKTSLLTALDNIVDFCSEDIYDFDMRAAIACARLHALALSLGRTPSIEDLMIASIAAVNNLAVATRNIKDFEYLGVPCVNPFGEN